VTRSCSEKVASAVAGVAGLGAAAYTPTVSDAGSNVALAPARTWSVHELEFTPVVYVATPGQLTVVTQVSVPATAERLIDPACAENAAHQIPDSTKTFICRMTDLEP
jgi:hypothetical protein